MMRPSLETAKPEPLAEGVIICTSPASRFATMSETEVLADMTGDGIGDGVGGATRVSTAATVASTSIVGAGTGAVRVSSADTVAGTFTGSTGLSAALAVWEELTRALAIRTGWVAGSTSAS